MGAVGSRLQLLESYVGGSHPTIIFRKSSFYTPRVLRTTGRVCHGRNYSRRFLFS